MISKANAIYNSLAEEFPDAMQAITDLSKNTQGNRNFVICDVTAFNFDLVANFSAAMPEKKEQSPDALFLHDDTLYFIEFKEGLNVGKTDIREKIHEAVITLFQYAASRNLATRAEFLDLKIKYAVVMRHKRKGHPSSVFLGVLEDSGHFFNLKNMEGLLVKETKVVFSPKAIFGLLAKISNGAVSRIKLMHSNQTEVEIFPAA